MIFLTLCSLFVVDNLLLYYICFEMSLFSASTLNQLTIVVCRDRSDDESTPNSSTPVKEMSPKNSSTSGNMPSSTHSDLRGWI